MLETNLRAEHSLTKKYRKLIWNRFIQAIREYGLIREGDSIAVCISGGKDSMLLAKLMQQLQRITEIPFTVSRLCAGEPEEDRGERGAAANSHPDF